MKKFLQVLGVVFLILIVGIAGLVLYKGKGGGPDIREVLKSDQGVKVTAEALGFYYKNELINGQVFRPVLADSTGRLPAVVYCQNVEKGKAICRDIAANGFVVYSFDFTSDKERTRINEIGQVVKQVGGLRNVDSSKIYILGEGQGCMDACSYTFDNSRKVAGLILMSPGFNPLELSWKAKRFSKDILIVDSSLGIKSNVKEIVSYISGTEEVK